MPRVSIGLPVFNGENFLEEALESLLSQTYQDFELIISDNASTDKTREICEAYAVKDRRIQYYRNETNCGAARNYNLVFELATGDYFKWASHDDVCGPTYLERCVEILDVYPSVALCYPKTVMIDEGGKKIRNCEDNLHLQSSTPHDRLRQFVKRVNLCNPVFGLIRSSSLKNTGLIGPYIASDYTLLIELCLQGKFWEVPEHLFLRRDHERNTRRLPLLECAKWWNPDYYGVLHNYPQIMLVYKYFLSIKHSQLSWVDKMRCYPQVGRWILRRWRAIGGKYKASLKKKLGIGQVATLG